MGTLSTFFASASRFRARRRNYRRIRQGSLRVHELPPYERGLYYEDFVCRWLKRRGYRVLDRNFRGRRRSEIDIIAKDGKTLVFIEVKARRRYSVYTPLRAVDRGKRISLSLVTEDYLRTLERAGLDRERLLIRYDVITVSFEADGAPSCLDQYVSYLVPEDESI